MSNEIKRIGWHGVHGMQKDAKGDYVLHSDHEAEVGRLRAELAKAHAAIESKAGWEWKKEADRLRAEVEKVRELMPEASVCVQFAIDYGSLSMQAARSELLKNIDAAMGEGK